MNMHETTINPHQWCGFYYKLETKYIEFKHRNMYYESITMIQLKNFLNKYNVQKAKELQHLDPQFLALQDCRNNVKNKDRNLFSFLIIQCALVSYQIAWTGELWRTEFWEKIKNNREILLDMRTNNQSNTERRFKFLKSSKNNKRIYNIKKNRIEKINQLLNSEKNFLQYHDKLEQLNEILAKAMNTNTYSKTIVFSIKMFWYAYTIITWKDINYPMSINIPIDSRIKKIYTLNTNKPSSDILQISKYFENLSKEFNISPLDLDTILRLDYRKEIK